MEVLVINLQLWHRQCFNSINTCPVSPIEVNNVFTNSAICLHRPNETMGEWVITLIEGDSVIEYNTSVLPYTLTV